MSVRAISAFLRKEFLNETSYRFNFAFTIFDLFTALLIYFFIQRLFGHRLLTHLVPFGVDYFAYVLLGICLFSFMGAGVGSLASQIRAEQLLGTLEAVLVTPIHPFALAVALSLWNALYAAIQAAILLTAGKFAFAAPVEQANLFSAVVILFLSIASFTGLGLLAASFIIILKRGDPITWLVHGLSGFLGGVYFPVTVLPPWLQILSSCIPVTYAIRAMQGAVYRGASLTDLASDLLVLCLFSLLLLPGSFFAFRHAIHRAKAEGTLSQY